MMRLAWVEAAHKHLPCTLRLDRYASFSLEPGAKDEYWIWIGGKGDTAALERVGKDIDDDACRGRREGLVEKVDVDEASVDWIVKLSECSRFR